VLSLLVLRTQSISGCLPWAAGSSLVSPAHHLSLKEEETELIYDGEKEEEKKGKQKNGWEAAGCHPEKHRMFPLKYLALSAQNMENGLGMAMKRSQKHW